jgi:two-component system, OmpR family, KDP operon response regulator KdpE
VPSFLQGLAPGLAVEPQSILVVEDDDGLRTTLVDALRSVTPHVREAASLADAMAACVADQPELVLLDLGLPDGDGSALLSALRAVTSVPVIVLSGREGDDEKVALLDAGADDFITKPCSARELLARVRGLLRRASSSMIARTWARIELDGVEIDLVEQRVVRHGVPQRLTPTEWLLLRALVLHAGRPVTPRQLWIMVWSREFGEPAAHVRVHVTHLRRKIEPDPTRPRLIVTEPGIGYRFVGP